MTFFPSRMLFRPVVLCPYLHETPVVDGKMTGWPEVTPLPGLGEMDGESVFARVWLGWTEAGLFIAMQCAKSDGGVLVANRRRPHSGDGMQVWIDTRASQDAHRASRFCHHFIMLPHAGANDLARGWQAKIRRAREQSTLAVPEDISVASSLKDEIFTLEAHLPARILTGFEPHAGVRLGFNYFIHRVPGGKQTWSAPLDLPADTDPSLWGIIELSP